MGDWPPPGPPTGLPVAGAPPPPTGAAAVLRPLTLADVLDGMFRLFLAHWRTYTLALGVVLIPQNFVVAYLTTEVFGGTGLFEQLSNPATAEAVVAGGDIVPFIGLIVVSLATFLFTTPFLNGVACRTAAEAYQQRDPTPGAVLRFALRRYWALIGVTLLIVLIPVAVLALPVASLVAGAVLEQPALAVLGGILIFFAVLAVIWLVLSYSLAYVVVVVEGAGPVNALRRSFRLVRGRFWRVFGTLILAAIISGLVAQVAVVPFSIPGDIFGDWLGLVFTTIGAVIAAVITTPLSANAQTLLYYDGRVRAEGYDLRLLVDEVTRGHAGGEHLFG